jgi:hypothetical protein
MKYLVRKAEKIIWHEAKGARPSFSFFPCALCHMPCGLISWVDKKYSLNSISYTKFEILI